MSGLGALSWLSKWLRVNGPEMLDRKRQEAIEEAGYMLAGGEEVSAANRANLLDYLRNEGADPVWADTMPGAYPVTASHGLPKGTPAVPQFRAPTPEDRLFRGSAPSLRLQEPVFTTTDPHGAMFYATEGRAADFGGLGEYSVEAAVPARLRDLYRVMLEEPGLVKYGVPNSNYKMWDHAYSPEIRQALRDRGYNSLVGLDPIERSEIETFIALDKNLLQPQSRRIVGFEGNPIGDYFRKRTPLGQEYEQYGETRPWSKRKKGGLVKFQEARVSK